MRDVRFRLAFAWVAAGIVVLALVASPIIDGRVRSNYRSMHATMSVDVLALGAATDEVLVSAYGLPQAVRDSAPQATLVLDRTGGEATWTTYRVAGLAGVRDIEFVDPLGVEPDVAALEPYVVARGLPQRGVPAWVVALDPDGNHSRLRLVTAFIDGAWVDIVCEESLVPLLHGATA